jgi:hypothetical protein
VLPTDEHTLDATFFNGASRASDANSKARCKRLLISLSCLSVGDAGKGAWNATTHISDCDVHLTLPNLV